MPQSRIAVITFLDGPGGGAYPDQGLPGLPAYPSQGLPGVPAYPSHGLPGGPALLPVYPFDPTVPDNGLPPGGGTPDNGLPRPGRKYVVKWLACSGLILVPDNTLPPTPEPKD